GQGVADLKARYATTEKVRTGLAAHGAKTDWPPPPDVDALEAAQETARRLKDQASAASVVPPPAPASAPAANSPEPAHRGLLAGFDAWWLIPVGVVVLVLALVVFGIRNRARRAGG